MGSVSGLEGSWRVEGELLGSVREQEGEANWETKNITHDRREQERNNALPAGGGSPNKARGGVPAAIAGIAVMASVMDTSRGRDKFLVCE